MRISVMGGLPSRQVETRQFSSFDQSCGNDDCGRILRVDPDGVVIWSTPAPTFLGSANRGMFLRHTGDQNDGYQQADVTIDGVSVGQWRQPLANQSHRWLDDSVQLPPSTTAGKSRITVTLRPVPDVPAWNSANPRAVLVG